MTNSLQKSLQGTNEMTNPLQYSLQRANGIDYIPLKKSSLQEADGITDSL